MPFDYQSESRGEYYWVKTTGVVESMEEQLQNTGLILHAAIEAGCDRLLIDDRDLVHPKQTTKTFNLAENVSSARPFPIQKTAIVVSQADLEDAKFFETVIRNRGLDVMIFTDIDEAERWVKE